MSLQMRQAAFSATIALAGASEGRECPLVHRGRGRDLVGCACQRGVWGCV